MSKPRLLLSCILTFSILSLTAQNMRAYQLYTPKGKKVSYKKMLKKLQPADIILFGEIHNNPISHWLQLEVAQNLTKSNDLIIGAEMFERDNQAALTQYMTNEIDRKALDSLVRLWNNYTTDYEPLVEFAKANYIPVIATNIPRKYARIVFKEGLEALEKLPTEEQKWIAPLPILFDIELPGYKNMLTMMGGDAAHSSLNFPKAQAIKDATMAFSILEYYKTGKTFLHLNGSYHSDNYEGILWYLQQSKPNLRYKTITTVSQKDIDALSKEHLGKADFIICVPENMTNTY
ncbi:MAG: ChaN family lipoprotein [Saprospiraceae bacterium]